MTLPPQTPAQKAEMVALTQALQLGEVKPSIFTKTSDKTCPYHSMEGKATVNGQHFVKNEDLILEVVIHCECHLKDGAIGKQGNN